MKKLLLILFTLFSLISCNFESAEDDVSGGGLFVNNQKVENQFFLVPLVSKTYLKTQTIDITVRHSSEVTVVGNPRIELTLDSGPVFADYLSGSSTKNLTFRYTVSSSDDDSDGINIDSTIDLNGATITFIEQGLSTNAGIEINEVLPSTILIDTVSPLISVVVPPTPSTYLKDQKLQFIVMFNDIVNVTGTPRIQLDIGGSTKYADYLSGSNSTSLIFSYLVDGSDTDLDGPTMVSPLELNSGLITDINGNNANLTFTPVPMPTTFINGDTPYVTAMAPPSDNIYYVNNVLTLALTFSEAVNITGAPRVVATVNGQTKYFNYISGSNTPTVNFQYIVQAGDDDLDGITLATSIDLNSGTIKDLTSMDAELGLVIPLLPNVKVDAGKPTVTSIQPPTDNTYTLFDEMYFTTTFNKEVTITGVPRLQISLDSHSPSYKYAEYISGSGTNQIIFRYQVQTAEQDVDGILIENTIDLNSGTIVAGNSVDAELDITAAVSSLDTSGVLINSLGPSVIAITAPIDGNYLTASNIDFTLIFSTAVNVSNIPRVAIDIGGSSVYANYLSGSGTNALTFRYIVAAPDIDNNGIELASSIDLNSTGLIQDTSFNNANLGLSSYIPIIPNVLINIAPAVIVSVTPPAGAIYLDAQSLNFIVNTDKSVDITGTPRLQLDVNGVTRYADYISGSGSTALNFTYTTQPEEDLDGIEFLSTVIDLNNGTMLDSLGVQPNLNLDTTQAVPDLTNIIIDGVIPTITILGALAVTSANESNYSLSGTCSEEGRIVSLEIDTISLTPICTSGSWTTGSVNVSSLSDNLSLPITADLTDVAGNNAIQAVTSIDKNTATPQVAIALSPDISSANVTGYSVSGTCTDVGIIVDVFIGTINIQPNCSGGTWTTGSVDVSSLADNASLLITADHLGAVQATINIIKDTLSSTVTITSSPNISLSNETSYIASGTCSDNATMVDVYIDSLNFQPTCSSGSWTTGIVDVSGLSDGGINITVDHSTATQAAVSINKNTATPTIATLSVPTSLTNSCDLSWNLNDPGGFTLDDYEINYKAKGSPTWLLFIDGVNANTTATVSNLIASTTYEFRVRLKYDTSTFSDWSNTAEGETKPDDPLFNSPYAAMNVGGSTDTKVVAYYDNTRVYHNGVELANSPLSKGQVVKLSEAPNNITTAQFDSIDADKPIYTAGRRGNSGAGASSKANIVWQPTAWAGKTFSFNATRFNPQQLFVYATENSTIEVKQGSTVIASTTVTAGNGATLSWSIYGSYQVLSTGTILAFHSSGDPSGTYADPKPLLPAFNEMIGFASNSMRLTTEKDSTNYNMIHSNSVAVSGTINKQDVIQVNSQGTGSYYQGESLYVFADQNISGASYADSNGYCASTFLPTNLMKRNYAINTNSDYVAFASKQAGTIDVKDGANNIIQTLTLTRSGSNPNAPFKVRIGTTAQGTRFFSTVPVAAWYQPNSDDGAGDEDETILYGTND
jgi:hypothetical protein